MNNIDNIDIKFANSNSYNSSAFSEGLTDYAAGYRSPALQDLLNTIAPPVKANKRFEYKKFNSDAFAVDSDDIRTTGSGHKKLKLSGEIVQAKLYNKGLTVTIDQDDMYDGYENEVVNLIIERLIRNDLLRAMGVLTTAAGTATAKKWMASGTGKTVADTDLAELITSVGDACGLDANMILMGSTAWNYRKASLLGSTAPGEGAVANLSQEDLRQNLAIEKLIVSSERYTIKSTSTGAKSKTGLVTSNYAFAFISRQGATSFDSTVMKRFVNPEGFRVYQEEHAKTIDITVEHYSNIAQTGVGAVKAIAVSNS